MEKDYISIGFYLMNKGASLIVTSIAAPNVALKALASGAKNCGMKFIVIGDVKSPPTFELDGCRFYSIAEQQQLSFKLARLLPVKHYSRKNIGYLLAADSELIIETDDDNIPLDDFWSERKRESSAQLIEGKWTNVYRFFSDENIWPRGYPLEMLASQNVSKGTIRELKCPVQQGLADDNPDVDAVFRMCMKLPVVFKRGNPVALGNGAWCPFNSQNTTWFREAFPLLYLPSYCSFRMTDIWRSFIAQRIAWTCDWPIMFHNANVRQERNDHNLLTDFQDEVSGYLNNAKICRQLEELDLLSGQKNISENLLRCYRMMTEYKFIGPDEMKLVEAWVEDIAETMAGK